MEIINTHNNEIIRKYEDQMNYNNNNYNNNNNNNNDEKTTLSSLRNIEWRIDKAETNKVNQVLTYISTNNITEFN